MSHSARTGKRADAPCASCFDYSTTESGVYRLPKNDFFTNESPQGEPFAFDALEAQMDRGVPTPPAQDFAGYTPLSFDLDDAPASRKNPAKASPFFFDDTETPAPTPFAFDFDGGAPTETPLTASKVPSAASPAPTPPAPPAPPKAPKSAPDEGAIRFSDLKPTSEMPSRRVKAIQIDELPPIAPKHPPKSTSLAWEELKRAPAVPKTAVLNIDGLEPIASKAAEPPIQPAPPAPANAAAASSPRQTVSAPAPAPQPEPAPRQTPPAPPPARSALSPRPADAAAANSAPPPAEDDGTIVAGSTFRTPPKAQTNDAPPVRRPKRPGMRPVSKIADSPTISFSLGNNVNVDVPTLAFVPISDITAAAKAEAEKAAKDSVVLPKQPAPSPRVRAARIEKERNVGAAVFSALMDTPDPADAETDSAEMEENTMQDPNWPAPPRPQNGQRGAPKPIDWNASLSQIPSQPQASPQTAPAGQKPPAAPPPAPGPAQQAPLPHTPPPAPAGNNGAPLSEDAAQPLSFDLDDAEPLNNDLLASYSRQLNRVDDSEDYEDDDDTPPRRRSSGGGPRLFSGGKDGSKALLGWIGFLLIAVLIILYFIFFGDKDGKNPSSGGSGSSSSSLSSSASDSVSSTPDDSSSDSAVDPVAEPIPRDEWYMVLANRDNRLSSDFTVPQTTTVGSAAVDSRIADALRQMVSDAAAAGIQLSPTNGYRTVGQQQAAWDTRVQGFVQQGLSQQEAEERALDYTSMPGASDHNTGLALDIVSVDHPQKNADTFEQTTASQWLAEHAAEYGFIQRYPKDKTEETGMDYEPWHYRYVGVDQATKIKESGLCLEEYLAQP